MSKIAIKTNKKLWESIKRKYIRRSKGGVPGKNSARKMQLAVKEYKSRGGKYSGSRKTTSLYKWTKEKWNYINKRKSPKGYRSGRYLPEKVRKRLSNKEKSRENKLKGSRRGKRIPYSRSVLKKMRKSRIF